MYSSGSAKSSSVKKCEGEAVKSAARCNKAMEWHGQEQKSVQ
nr:MAG TPA: hypothetical protein [Bacteriophage sp.]